MLFRSCCGAQPAAARGGALLQRTAADDAARCSALPRTTLHGAGGSTAEAARARAQASAARAVLRPRYVAARALTDPPLPSHPFPPLSWHHSPRHVAGAFTSALGEDGKEFKESAASEFYSDPSMVKKK